MGDNVYLILFINLSLVVDLAAIRILLNYKRLGSKDNDIFYGIFLSIITIISMSYPVMLQSGVTLDLRVPLIATAALYSNPLSLGILLFFAIGYRIYIGGVGMIAGITAMVITALLGILYSRFVYDFEDDLQKNFLHNFFFGIIISLIIPSLVYLIPISSEAQVALFNTIFFPILLLFPISMLLFGVVLHIGNIVEQYIQSREEAQSAQQRVYQLENQINTLSLFSAGVSHDLRNFIQIISAGIELLTINQPEEEDLATNLYYAIVQANDITDQLLNFAASIDKDYRSEIIHFEEYIKEVDMLLKLSISQDVDIEYDIDNIKLNFNKSFLTQVLFNLVLNASESLNGDPDTHLITISSYSYLFDTMDGYYVGEFKPGQYNVISVKDRGSGMDQELLEKIFVP